MKHIKIIDITKKVPFLNQEVEIKQLTVKAIKDLQVSLEKGKANKNSVLSNVGTLTSIFKSAVVGAEDMTDKDFEKFPISALTDLSNEILKFNNLIAKDDTGDTLGK
jgi:hypothetical protein